jgi:flavin-dependent dehydrogenase
LPDTETPREFDVVVLGGGPGGTAVALSLKKHAPSLSVAIVEASRYEDTRIGETLTPIAQPLLKHLDVWNRFTADDHLSSYGSCSAWGSDELVANEFIYYPHNRGWHLDRRRFDSLLASEASQKGVILLTDSTLVGSGSRIDGRWQLTVRSSREMSTLIETSFVVDATGRRAAFARQQAAGDVALDQLLGCFVFFDRDDKIAGDTHTLVEAWEQGWWYYALLPDAKAVVACMTDADISRKRGLRHSAEWFDLLMQTKHVSNRIRTAKALMQPVVRAAHSRRLSTFAGDGWLAVGDAASTFDPLSSHGIFKALRSGILAAYAIIDSFKGVSSGLEKYAAILNREYTEYLETRTEYYGRERRWRGSAFWERRISDQA